MKMLNGTGPSIDPPGTLLGTGLQLGFVALMTTLWARSVRPFSIHLALHLGNHTLSIHLRGPYMRSVRSLTGAQTDSIYRSPLIQQAGQLTVEGDRPG